MTTMEVATAIGDVVVEPDTTTNVDETTAVGDIWLMTNSTLQNTTGIKVSMLYHRSKITYGKICCLSTKDLFSKFSKHKILVYVDRCCVCICSIH